MLGFSAGFSVDCAAAGFERAAMGRAVDSAGQSADHDEATRGEFKAQPLGHPQPRFASRACTDHRYAGRVVGLEQTARDQVGRRVGDLLKVGRILVVGPSHQPRAQARQLAQLLLQRREVVETGDRGGDFTPDPGRGDLIFGGFENLLGGAETLEEQAAATWRVPSDEDIVIERCRDELGDWRICVLTPYGTRVHAPWCMAAMSRLSSEIGLEAESMWSDDGFVIRLPDTEEPIDSDFLLPAVAEFKDLVLRQLGSTSLPGRR